METHGAIDKSDGGSRRVSVEHSNGVQQCLRLKRLNFPGIVLRSRGGLVWRSMKTLDGFVKLPRHGMRNGDAMTIDVHAEITCAFPVKVTKPKPQFLPVISEEGRSTSTIVPGAP